MELKCRRFIKEKAVATIEISFSPKAPIELTQQDVLLGKIIESMVAAMEGMSEKMRESWDFYNPEILVQPASDRPVTPLLIKMRFHCKDKSIPSNGEK